MPGRTALEDGEVSRRDLTFDANLMPGVVGHACIAPALHPDNVQLGESGGHGLGPFRHALCLVADTLGGSEGLVLLLCRFAEHRKRSVEALLAPTVRFVVGRGGHVPGQFLEVILPRGQDDVVVVSTSPVDDPFALRV